MLHETRQERLKSGLYLRLKKRKVFKICPGRIYEKLRKQFRDTQRVPSILGKTRSPLFPQLENWKQKKFKILIFSFGKCSIVPKNVKGGTL